MVTRLRKSPHLKGERTVSKQQTLTGTGTLLRFMLRRDRIQLPVWILSITIAVVATLASLAELYATEEDRQLIATTLASPASIAMTGPDFYLNDYTLGAMIAHQMIGITGIIVALMSVFIIVRHTRKEEETGRTELVRASVTGRHANTTAVLILVLGVNFVLALLVALGMGSLGIESVTWEGSFLFGIALASIGFVFTGLTILIVQFMENSRGAIGLSAGMIAVFFSLRAVGDLGEGTLSWLSPIGWAQQSAPFVDNNWAPLLLSLGLTIFFLTITYPLSTKRDVGSGMVPPRRGSEKASDILTNPIGLAFRLQRTNLIIWSFAMLLFGMAYGSFIGEAEEMALTLGDTLDEMLPALDGGELADSFAAMFMSIAAMVAAIPALQSILRLRGEEKAGRIEPLLSAALSRTRLLGSYVIVALLSSIFLLFMAGIGMGLTGSQSMNDSGYLASLTGAGLAFGPALWVTIGLGTALFGIFPKGTALSWLVVVYAIIAVYLGGILQLPEWMINISPFEHIPSIPAENFAWAPLLSLTVIAAILLVIGWLGFNRRDIEM